MHFIDLKLGNYRTRDQWQLKLKNKKPFVWSLMKNFCHYIFRTGIWRPLYQHCHILLIWFCLVSLTASCFILKFNSVWGHLPCLIIAAYPDCFHLCVCVVCSLSHASLSCLPCQRSSVCLVLSLFIKSDLHLHCVLPEAEGTFVVLILFSPEWLVITLIRPFSL